ncbi:MAG TPA: hypothetical protein VJB93_00265 [Patescibacteria group bacterium]|nr:hypothetical protein [Patescibacteria group bacterium]
MFDDIGTIQPQGNQPLGTPPGAPPPNLPIAPVNPAPSSTPVPPMAEQGMNTPTGIVDMFSEHTPVPLSPVSAVSAGKIAPKTMPEVPQPQSTKSPKQKGNKKIIMIIISSIVGLGVIIGITMAVLSVMKKPTLDDLPEFDTTSDTNSAPVDESQVGTLPILESYPAPSDANTGEPAIENQEGSTQEQPLQDQPVIVDTDGDGLTDQDETQYGTNQFFPDTDFDGLTDREEVETYTTDPLSKDTDGDGFDDGQEVRNGYNPKGPGKQGE